MKRLFKPIILGVCLVILSIFLSYKILDVPNGITGDEAAFGYNGVLLSRNLHDENGRNHPVFVLSINGTDWRQPVTQYFIAAYFRLFGPSLFNLRFTTVIVAVLSVLLIYLLGKELFQSELGGILSSLFLLTTPIFMIHSHLGLDNIYPVPFILLWFFSLYKFTKTKKYYWLIFSALSLGVGLYSYKAMRIFVPTWALCSVFYIYKKENIKYVLLFIATLLPFFLIIPKLEFLYAGAVLNNEHLSFPSIYDFMLRYLSCFDTSFLYVKGDDLLFHSTGIHGVYLLSSLPFFLIGLFSSWNKDRVWKFIIILFFTGPILFGLFGSIHRASRLISEVPIYSLISASGFIYLFNKKSKLILIVLSALLLINYFDFLHYYLYNYSDKTKNLFNCFSCSEEAYRELKSETQSGKIPYVDSVLVKNEGETQYFARSIYFDKQIGSWNGQIKTLSGNFVVMTDNSNVSGLRKIKQVGSYYFYSEN